MELLRLGRAEEAFRALVGTYGERLYFHIRRFGLSHEDTDDLLQEVYIKVWAGLPSFRGDSGLYTWLYRVATNGVLNFLRKAKVRAFLSGESLDAYLNNIIDRDPGFDGNELQRELQKAINTLPPKQKEVFLLRYFDEMPYEEIATLTGVTAGSLKASYHHAYNKVKEYLEKRF